MALDSQKITDLSRKFSAQGQDSMVMAAQSLGGDASEEDVREAVAKIVTTMLNEQWRIVRWFISEEWVAKLIARVVDAVGQTVLDWLR